MRSWIVRAVMFLALLLALSGCVGESWVGSKPEPTQVLEKAVEIGRGEATLDELRALAVPLAEQYRGAGGGTGGLCRFDANGDDKLSDEEMLNIITAWIKGQLSNEELLTALTLWIRGSLLGCLGYGGGFDRIAARDVAIAYIHNTDPQSGIPSGVDWLEEDITPAGLVGIAIFRYTWPARAYRTWRVLVRYPIVPNPAYRVEVTNLQWPHTLACWVVEGSFRCGYWQLTVSSTSPGLIEIEEIPPFEIKGPVVVGAPGTRSESWGIQVTEGPPEYIGKEVGLKSYTEMQPHLLKEGKLFTVEVYKICRSFDEAEGCCACVFELCAPALAGWRDP